MRYRHSSRWHRWGPKRQPLVLERLESRRVLTVQLETGLALEDVDYHSPIHGDGVASAIQSDLDGDGQLDLFAVTSQEIALFYAGRGDGTYANPVVLSEGLPALPWIPTDVDQDGDQDLLAIRPEGQLLLAVNAGREGNVWRGLQPFTEQSVFPSGDVRTFVAADFNSDGYVDLAIGSAEGVRVEMGVGDGTFAGEISYPLSRGSQTLVIGDLDTDGDLDLISAKTADYGYAERQHLDLLINDGTGIFEPGEGQFELNRHVNDLAMGDLDNDGDLDLVAAHPYFYGGNVKVFLGNGQGDFVTDPLPLTVAGLPRAVTLGDVDADGDLDVCVAHTGGYGHWYTGSPGASLFLGRGNGNFGARLLVAQGYPVLAVSSQLDGTGVQELTIAGSEGHVQVLRLVDSDLLPPTSWVVTDGMVGESLEATGDWDANGIQDYVRTSAAGPELALNPSSELATTLPLGTRTTWYQLFLQDMTGDGRIDILATGFEGTYVLPQGPDGLPGEAVLTPMSFMTAVADSIVDLNRDSINDLLLSDGSSLHVWLGQGDGSFRSDGGSLAMGFRAFRVADWDADGYADLMVVAGATLSVLHGEPTGTFREISRVTVAPDALPEIVTDLDLDADLDVIMRGVTVGRWPGPAQILFNAGDGSLQETVQTNYYWFNEDREKGWSALAFQSSRGLVVQQATTQHNFTEIVLPSSPDNSAWVDAIGDLDRDGDVDVIVRDNSGYRVLVSSQDGAWSELAQSTIYPNFTDWNRDGLTDLMVVSGSVLRVLTRDAAGNYSEQLRLALSANTHPETTADLDGDGDPDLILRNINDSTLRVLQNSGDAVFIEIARGNAYRLADLDADGKTELMLTRAMKIIVYGVGGDGQYQQLSETGIPSDYYFDAVADLDGDGDLDITLRNMNNNYVRVLLNTGGATFKEVAHTTYFQFADWNVDGQVDLLFLVPSWPRSELKVLPGDGRGDFGPAVVTTTNIDVFFDAAIDRDGDGDLDITLRNTNNNYVRVLLNSGDATFNQVAHATYFQFADWNADGQVDLLFVDGSTSGSELKVLPGDGPGNFGPAVVTTIASPGWVELTQDLDDDGDLDVVLRGGNDNLAQILLNIGGGKFNELARVSGYFIADFNNDGRRDFLSWSTSALTVRLRGANDTYDEVFRMPLAAGYGHVHSVRDLDGDGDIDVVLRTDAVHLLMNNGDGSFRDVDTVVLNADIFDARDFDGDGWIDILAWGNGQALTIFLGDGVEPYQEVLTLPVRGNVHMLDGPVDLDRDGYFDQVIAWEPSGWRWRATTRVMVLWGTQSGQFRPPVEIVFPTATGLDNSEAIPIAARDLDQDGDADLLLAGNRVLHNRAEALQPRGDVDGNKRIDVADVDRLSAAIRMHDPRWALFDLNRDGPIDEQDLMFLVRNILSTQPGDANLDGRFDSSDLVLIFQSGEYEDATFGNSTWAEGDWDGDGDFTSSDIVLAFQSGEYEATDHGRAA